MKTGKRRAVWSGQTVGGGAEEGEEAEVSEDLELLSDFGADVGVFGMELGKGIGAGVDIRKREFRFVQGLNDLQNIQGPAALFDIQLLAWPRLPGRAVNPFWVVSFAVHLVRALWPSAAAENETRSGVSAQT